VTKPSPSKVVSPTQQRVTEKTSHQSAAATHKAKPQQTAASVNIAAAAIKNRQAQLLKTTPTQKSGESRTSASKQPIVKQQQKQTPQHGASKHPPPAASKPPTHPPPPHAQIKTKILTAKPFIKPVTLNKLVKSNVIQKLPIKTVVHPQKVRPVGIVVTPPKPNIVLKKGSIKKVQ